MRIVRETYLDLIYTGSRKRQYILRKLKAWVLLGGGLTGRGRAWRGAEENIELKKVNKNIAQ